MDKKKKKFFKKCPNATKLASTTLTSNPVHAVEELTSQSIFTKVSLSASVSSVWIFFSFLFFDGETEISLHIEIEQQERWTKERDH